jgi:uncharacterized protein (TIGR02391 family)
MPLRFVDHVLLKARDIQGNRPPDMLPQHAESDLTSAFAGSPYEVSAQDRGVLLKAMQELKSRGWMELIEVMGPWSWQLTDAGLNRADQVDQEEKKAISSAEATLRTQILEAYEAQARHGRPGGMPPPVDVAGFCAEHSISPDEFEVQARRLVDQGMIDLKNLARNSLSEGLGFITESGRQRLEAPPPGAAPSRRVAELYQEIAKLRHELDIAKATPDGLIRDTQLRDRVEGLLAEERNYDRAVREASVVLEDRVRTKSGLAGLHGVDLMSAAFKEETGALIVSDNSAEQAGVHMAFRGMVAWVRNSFGHRLIDATAQGDAMRIVAFIDWLLEEVGRARLR